jgi:hypothetical protein
MNQKVINRFVIGVFVLLYLLTSIISTIHVIDFFKLSNADWLAITLAVAFEVGAAASLASIIALKKMNKSIVWALFFILTAMQAMGNTYYAFTHLHDFQNWIDLFGLTDFELIAQKRILSIVSGAVLPLVALGFIKSLVDYIKPETEVTVPAIPEEIFTSVQGEEPVDINKVIEEAPTVEPKPIIIEPIVQEESVEPIIEESTEEVIIEPIVQEVIEEPVVEEIIEQPRFTEEQNKILESIRVWR